MVSVLELDQAFEPGLALAGEDGEHPERGHQAEDDRGHCVHFVGDRKGYGREGGIDGIDPDLPRLLAKRRSLSTASRTLEAVKSATN